MTEVGPVVGGEGELRFSVTTDGEPQQIHVRTSLPVVAGADVAAALTVLPAMARGGVLRLADPVEETLLRNIGEIEAVLHSWRRRGDWPPGAVFDRPLELDCRPAPTPRWDPGREVGAFFSGGVDSFATLIASPEITHLIYISGFDVPLDDAQRDARSRELLAGAASELGKSFVTVETNARELGDRYVDFLAYFGAIQGAIARLLAPALRRVYIASGVEYPDPIPNGSHPLLDHLWGADGLEVVHHGAGLTRMEKMRMLADNPVAHRGLRVCWQAAGPEINCGRCEKCLRAMAALEALGVRERFVALPAELDLDRIAALEPRNSAETGYWTEALDLATTRGGNDDLVAAIEAFLANARPGARARRLSSTPVPNPGAERGLYMRPGARLALEGSHAVVFLVGGYVGTGNYGDVAQLQGAAELVDGLGDGVAALPVLELTHVPTHCASSFTATRCFDPERWLAFAPADGPTETAAFEAGLVPATLPPSVTRAATYLYGGGYLNARWGRSRLAMAEAVDALAGRWGVSEHALVSSGLQIEPSWVHDLAGTPRRLLQRVDRIRVRDPLSLQAAGALADEHGAPEATLGCDDAVGVIAAAVDGRPGPGRPAALPVNVHINGQEWVTDDPDRLVEFFTGLVEALGAAAGRPVEVQPVIAYEDAWWSERPTLTRLTAATRSRRGVGHVAEPLVLRASRLADAASALSRAELTVSCSYHVALTSLLLGVPAALVRGNGYYAQKAEGLRRVFALPAELFLDPSADPAAAAAGLLARIVGGDGEARADLDRGRERVLSSRATTEEELGAALRSWLERRPATREGAAPAINDAELRALVRSAERAEARIAELSATVAWQEARLRDIESSASWRWTAPLRRTKRRLY